VWDPNILKIKKKKQEMRKKQKDHTKHDVCEGLDWIDCGGKILWWVLTRGIGLIVVIKYYCGC
jgi:hypothetical protein